MSALHFELALVLEQIIKRRARVIRTLTAFAGCFFFDHHADGIERAVVALVLGRDSGGNRLIAFEAAGRVEVFALFAGVQVEPALRALPDRSREILQQRSAFRAAGNGARSRHVDRARPERILFSRSRWLLELFFRSGTGILVSALPILAVGQKRLLKNALFSAFGAFGTRVSLVQSFLGAPQQPGCGKPPLLGLASRGAVNCLSHIRVLPF